MESMEIKMARLEIKIDNVEKRIEGVDMKIDSIHKRLDEFTGTSHDIFVRKDEFIFWRNLIVSGLLISIAIGLFMTIIKR